MKKLLLTAVAMLTALSNVAAQKYVDAATLTVEGRAKPSTVSPWARLDPEEYNFEEEAIRRYCHYTPGVYVMFRTDSKNISARWTNVPRTTGSNMTPILQRGLDLYIKRDGRWMPAGVGRPASDDKKGINKDTIVRDMASGVKECMLYLPIWCEITSLEIGIDDDASIEPAASPYRYKVLVLGSSITHGASASRPGLIYTALMSRKANIDFVNLGFSGNCKMQPQFAQLIADCEADAYLFDAFSNPSTNEIKERTAAFVKAVSEAHPDKPMIFLQTNVRDRSLFDAKWCEYDTDRRETVRRLMKEQAALYRNVYFLDSDDMLGHDHEATVDGVHPTDLGYDRFVKVWLPKICKVLKKYGIK